MNPARPPADDDRRAPLPALASIVAVARFQLARLVTPARLVLAVLGATFPLAVMGAAVKAIGDQLPREAGVLMLFALVPEVVCMLGLLVTMSPAVTDELERGTWAHVAVRPGGRRALLLGTWLAAVIWTVSVALAALVLVLRAGVIRGGENIGSTFAALVVLSAVGRAALFALPAVIVPKKALVATVGVAVLVEVLAGLIPAVVNQFTVSLRLRTLLVAWMGWQREMPAELHMIIDPYRPWWQVASVVGLTVLFLAVACAILEWRQFPPSEET